MHRTLLLRKIAAGLLATGILAGCAKKQEQQTDLVTFPLRGKVVSIDTAGMRITVAHEAIPNYMNAMTMPFKVRDRAQLRMIGVGDSIAATLAVSRTESWLEGITRTAPGKPGLTLSAEEILTAKIFKTGESFPDEALLDQGGRNFRFSNSRGKVLLLTFIYTRCPLPDYCIRMSNNFVKIQKMLKKEADIAGKWHLISVSFDPRFDRPAALKRYAATYDADLSTWDFTTDPDTLGTGIRRLADGLGLSYADDQGLIAHNMRTVLIDREGTLVQVINGNEWSPDEVAAKMRKLALR